MIEYTPSVYVAQVLRLRLAARLANGLPAGCEARVAGSRAGGWQPERLASERELRTDHPQGSLVTESIILLNYL